MNKQDRMLRGYLRSRVAIRKFLDGDSGREFVVRVVGDDMSDTSERLRPYEGADRDWYTLELGCISGGSFSLDEIDAARKKCGGVLEVISPC